MENEGDRGFVVVDEKGKKFEKFALWVEVLASARGASLLRE